MLTRYQIQDFAVLRGDSTDPRKKPDSIWSLYSLPAFDNNQNCERVLGKEILSNKYIVPDKCILFNKLNVRFKRIWRINNSDDLKICSTEFLPLVIDESKVDFDFCYYLLQRDEITSFLEGQNSGTSGSHKRIKPNAFMEMEVMLPSLEEQKRIASILCSLDEKIANNDILNNRLEQASRDLYDYYFNNRQFPQNNWEVRCLGDIADIMNGATPDTSNPSNYGGEIVWITPKDLSDQDSKFVYYGERNITQSGYDSCSTKLLPPWTILMSSRAPIGLISIAMVEVCTNQGFKSFVFKDEALVPYMYYYLMYHIKSIEQLGSGTTFKEVSRDSMMKYEVLLPPIEQLKVFYEAVMPLFMEQYIITCETNNLKKEKSRILPLLMTGQVKVL